MLSFWWGHWALGGGVFLSPRIRNYYADSRLYDGTRTDYFTWRDRAEEYSFAAGGVYQEAPWIMAASIALLDRQAPYEVFSARSWRARLGGAVDVVGMRILAEYERIPFYSVAGRDRLHCGVESSLGRMFALRAGLIYSENSFTLPREIGSTDVTVGASCTVGRFRFDVAYLLERLERDAISLGVVFAD